MVFLFFFLLAILGAWTIISLSNKEIIPPSSRKWFWCLLVLVLWVSRNSGYVSSESSSYSERDLGTIVSNENHTLDIPLIFQGETKFSEIRLLYFFKEKNGVEAMDAYVNLNGPISYGTSAILMAWNLSVNRPTVTVGVAEKEEGFLIYPVYINYSAFFNNKTFFSNETRTRDESINLRIKRPIIQISQEKK